MTSKTRAVSSQTRNNWLIDTVLFLGGAIAAVSGVYFLYLPTGGYQGGRNPMYGITILASRSTWEDWHTWGGFLMIAAVAIHLAVHWQWVVNMAKRAVRTLAGRSPYLSTRSWINVAINATVAISFILTALSGVYLYLVPGGAALRRLGDPMLLASRSTWEMMHTWAGVVAVAAVAIHFAIHWGWVVKVTRSVVSSMPGASLRSRSAQQAVES